MEKNTMIIIIDSLERGGAEVLLVGILKELNLRFNVILVTLSDHCDFKNEEILCKKKYCLGFNNKLSLLRCILKLKRIIKKHQPILIHSHLFYSSLTGRIACPPSIPLIYSLHNEMSKSVFNNSRILKFLEKKTIRKNDTVIAVSKSVLIDYENAIKKNPSSFVLKNFVSDVYFKEKRNKKNFNNLQKINMVAVGNIKNQKNYIYLIKAFRQMAEYDISLDIYGSGSEKDFKTLRHETQQDNLPVFFKGSIDNPYEILHHYDLYVSCSTHEGFGIAPVEAMASGLPLLLSDLPVFHEITFENALFFDVNNTLSFVNMIKGIFERKYNLNELSRDGMEIAKKYTEEIYLKSLFGIYDGILNKDFRVQFNY